MEFSILEPAGPKQKSKFPLLWHDQLKVAEIHMRTFAGSSHILELFAALVAILLLPETATMEPRSSGSSLQVRMGWGFISSTVCLHVLVSVSTEVSWE